MYNLSSTYIHEFRQHFDGAENNKKFYRKKRSGLKLECYKTEGGRSKISEKDYKFWKIKLYELIHFTVDDLEKLFDDDGR